MMPQVNFMTIQVHDMDAALKFYVDGLGFTVQRRVNYPHFVTLEHDPFPIALHAPGERTSIRYGQQATIILGINTDNLVETMMKLQAQGYEFIHDEPQPFFLGMYAALRDPSGNVIELIQR